MYAEFAAAVVCEEGKVLAAVTDAIQPQYKVEDEAFTFKGTKKELEFDIPSRMRDVSFDAHALNIGQDGLGTYSYKLSATLDEMIVTADVLSETDIAALKAHYR